ncbi:MAG: M28 family peptidase [archaeon]|nr:M28 family peptidase [archaeon]
MQIFLANQTFYIPIYFAYENEKLNSIVESLKQEYKIEQGESKKTILDYLGINKNFLHFSLKIKDPAKQKAVQLENFYGLLEVGNSNEIQNPIIAIVTYYDSLGVISDLPSGMNSNGSGIIALMELIRILSKFYENYDNVIKYDILFLMTSAGNLNFEGTQHFLNTLEPSISENLQFVLCLDSLASLNEEDLFLHLSRFPKDFEESSNKLYKIFNLTSQNMNINLNYNKKKVFLNNKVVPWEHEQFSKKKILSATLSTLKEPILNDFNRTLMTDVQLNKTLLKRNIKFIAESLLSFLFDYNINKFAIFKNDENLIDDNNVDSMIEYLNKISRFPLSIEKGSNFNNDIYQFFNTYLKKVKRQVFEYNELKFFKNNSGDLKIFTVKSKMIDLYLLLSIFSYLLGIYIYTKGLKNFLIGVKSIFQSEDY